MITEELINELISCPKKAVRADRKRMVAVNRSLRNNVALLSEDDRYTYDLFLRQSEEFMEDFSVGLRWTNAAGFIGVNKDILLIRFQGPHDSGKPLGEDLHHDYHIHQITTEDIRQRRYFRPSNFGSSKDFCSFSGALIAFVGRCGIIGLEKVIDMSPFQAPLSNQLSLFE